MPVAMERTKEFRNGWREVSGSHFRRQERCRWLRFRCEDWRQIDWNSCRETEVSGHADLLNIDRVGRGRESKGTGNLRFQ